MLTSSARASAARWCASTGWRPHSMFVIDVRVSCTTDASFSCVSFFSLRAVRMRLPSSK